MNYLLDTHVLIWFTEDKLPINIREIINNPQNRKYVSIVSLWEIAIKININKLKLNFSFSQLLHDIEIRDFNMIYTNEEHLKTFIDLPLIHKDPFDRLLVATAIFENLVIITQDQNIWKYDSKHQWV
jgi:PIN domain nuclease of toxin-antitoxin system